jgi:hypothetical protein
MRWRLPCFPYGYGGTRFAPPPKQLWRAGGCSSMALVVKDANKWDVREHVPPRLL